VTLHTHFTDPTSVPRQLKMTQIKNIHMMTQTGFIRGHINKCKNRK